MTSDHDHAIAARPALQTQHSDNISWSSLSKQADESSSGKPVWRLLFANKSQMLYNTGSCCAMYDDFSRIESWALQERIQPRDVSLMILVELHAERYNKRSSPAAMYHIMIFSWIGSRTLYSKEFGSAIGDAWWFYLNWKPNAIQQSRKNAIPRCIMILVKSKTECYSVKCTAPRWFRWFMISVELIQVCHQRQHYDSMTAACLKTFLLGIDSSTTTI